MVETVPESDLEFGSLMRSIDVALIEQRVPISARPIRAIGIVSSRFGIEIPIGPPSARLPGFLSVNAELGSRINRWFRERYGPRLRIDMCPGTIVSSLDGDLYEIRIPYISGSARFYASRSFSPNPEFSLRGPAVCNVVQLVNGLTPQRAADLSDEALATIVDDFRVGIHALTTMEAGRDSKLIWTAQGDIRTAVDFLMSSDRNYGASKWASLQASEKILKASLQLHGSKFPQTHVLNTLCERLNDIGIVGDWHGLIQAIQCTPAIRYGEEECSRDDALAAHRSSLRLVLACVKGGARLSQALR